MDAEIALEPNFTILGIFPDLRLNFNFLLLKILLLIANKMITIFWPLLNGRTISVPYRAKIELFY